MMKDQFGLRFVFWKYQCRRNINVNSLLQGQPQTNNRNKGIFSDDHTLTVIIISRDPLDYFWTFKSLGNTWVLSKLPLSLGVGIYSRFSSHFRYEL